MKLISRKKHTLNLGLDSMCVFLVPEKEQPLRGTTPIGVVL
jgi:hypothetical protein